MSKLLEVIVTSAEEAVEAERGGADRLELVRSLEAGGLTPLREIVRQVVGSVTIPVRVMLRENDSMSMDGDLETLKARAREFAGMGVDGFVLGFVKNGRIDLDNTHEILSAAPGVPATFHRAFEYATDPFRAIEDLKRTPQVDRILTGGGDGSSEERRKRLVEWQSAASPRIKILVGVGVCSQFLSELNQEPALSEIHVGRAARVPQVTSGTVSRERIAALKI